MRNFNKTSFSDNAIIYKSAIRVKSQLIYSLTLIFLISIICMLPFIKTSINVLGRGIMQSSLEKVELTIPISGRLSSLRITDNKKILKGDTVLTIDADLPKKQSGLVGIRVTEIRSLINDISKIIPEVGAGSMNTASLSTGQYNAAWQQYLQELENAKLALVQV